MIKSSVSLRWWLDLLSYLRILRCSLRVLQLVVYSDAGVWSENIMFGDFSVSWWSLPCGWRNIPIPETEPSPNCNESKAWLFVCIGDFHGDCFMIDLTKEVFFWRAIVWEHGGPKIHAIHLGMRRKVHWNQHRSKWHCPVDTSARWWAMVLPTLWEKRLSSSTLGRIEEKLQELFSYRLNSGTPLNFTRLHSWWELGNSPWVWQHCAGALRQDLNNDGWNDNPMSTIFSGSWSSEPQGHVKSFLSVSSQLPETWFAVTVPVCGIWMYLNKFEWMGSTSNRFSTLTLFFLCRFFWCFSMTGTYLNGRSEENVCKYSLDGTLFAHLGRFATTVGWPFWRQGVCCLPFSGNQDIYIIYIYIDILYITMYIYITVITLYNESPCDNLVFAWEFVFWSCCQQSWHVSPLQEAIRWRALLCEEPFVTAAQGWSHECSLAGTPSWWVHGRWFIYCEFSILIINLASEMKSISCVSLVDPIHFHHLACSISNADFIYCKHNLPQGIVKYFMHSWAT